MTNHDRAAMELAVETVRREGRHERERIDQEISERGFLRAAEGAVYSCQYRSLHLKPWQPTPSWIAVSEIDAIISKGDDGTGGKYAAAKLLKRMLAANISQWHPAPEQALREAARKPAA
jgi:hypothetical protein